MHASGSVLGKCYRCCFCSSFLSSIGLHLPKKSEKCSMPSCLRANVNQQDKPSEGVMGLTTDDPFVLSSILWPVSCAEPQAAGEKGWKYSKEPTAVHHFGAEKGMMHDQATFFFFGSPPTCGVGKLEIRHRKVRKQEITSKCEEYSRFKFSVPHQENAGMGFGVLLLERTCRQVLSQNAPAAPRVFCAPRITNISRSLMMSVLAEGPRTDL